MFSGIFDFTRVRGLEGFYLANIVTDMTIEDSTIVSLFTFDNGFVKVRNQLN